MSIDRISFNTNYFFVNPDSLAQQYVNQGIAKDLNEARAMLRAKYGEPVRNSEVNTSGTNMVQSSSATQKSDKNSSVPSEEIQGLLACGIPVDVIAQGDNAIKKYAEENNIDLPEKKTGRNLDIFG